MRCERLAIVGDIVIRPDDRLEQDVCFYFTVTAEQDVSGLPVVDSQEPGVEVAWIPLAELGRVALVPPSLDTVIPRALASDAALYVTYDCRLNPDERGSTYIWF